MFTMVVSSTTINCAMPSRARIHQRRWCCRSDGAVKVAPGESCARSRVVVTAVQTLEPKVSTAVKLAQAQMTPAVLWPSSHPGDHAPASVQQVLPVRRHLSLRAGHRLIGGTAHRRCELRTARVVLGL